MVIHMFKRIPKKARVVLVVLAVALVGTVSFVFFKNNKKTAEIAKETLDHEGETLLALLDSDGDGLKDWEEAIYKTDSKNSDTDGDGAKDGDEIAENRDPKRAGPDDILHEKPAREISSYPLLEKISEKGNMTEALFQYVLQTKGAAFFNKKNIKSISSELAQSIKQFQEKEIPFSEHAIPDSEIIISDDESDMGIKNYFNAMAESYEKAGAFSIADDETSILAAAMQKKDTAILDMISEHSAVTERIIQSVKMIAVPRSLAAFHKKDLWYLEKSRNQFALLQKTNLEDPFYVITVTNLRLNTKKEFGEFHTKEIPQWLARHHLAFSEKESASLLYSPQIQ